MTHDLPDNLTKDFSEACSLVYPVKLLLEEIDGSGRFSEITNIDKLPDIREIITLGQKAYNLPESWFRGDDISTLIADASINKTRKTEYAQKSEKLHVIYKEPYFQQNAYETKGILETCDNILLRFTGHGSAEEENVIASLQNRPSQIEKTWIELALLVLAVYY